MKNNIQRPSHEEFKQTVEHEFEFLETEYGFIKNWGKLGTYIIL